MKITPNFDSSEFACRTGEPYPLDTPESDGLPTGYHLLASQPGTWRFTRLQPLCEMLEVVRNAFGGTPVWISSGYRTVAYDEKLYRAHVEAMGGDDGLVAPASRSQHPQGRAADIIVAGIHPATVFSKVMELYSDGKLPYLGGVGLYPNFNHLDVRPRSKGGMHLAIWGGARPENVV